MGRGQLSAAEIYADVGVYTRAGPQDFWADTLTINYHYRKAVTPARHLFVQRDKHMCLLVTHFLVTTVRTAMT